jgi:hypothetical protein
MLCLLALTSLTAISHAQGSSANVTTWHNDPNRTGWQYYETALSPATVSPPKAFGLLWQWFVTGAVLAQPLAVTLQQSVGTTCNSPCSLVFIATEEDMLYAFNATSSSQTPVWSVNLASRVGGQPVACQSLTFDFAPCDGVGGTPPGSNGGVVGPYGGATGTPVIDMTTNPNTLYVVAPVLSCGGDCITYYLFAVNIATTNHTTVPSIAIGQNGGVTGNPPPNASTSGKCTSDYPTAGTVNFDFNHIQRSGLLLWPNGRVYVAFAPGGKEVENGWMFGYSFNAGTGTLTQTAIFASTPWGTGGGIWGSGAGPASDASSIYATTGNGTTFDVTMLSPVDMGDSLLKLSTPNLAMVDYYTPSDAFTYSGSKGTGRCINDIDLGSGGVLLIPDNFYFDRNTGTHPYLVVNADKESRLYVANRDNLGKFNANANCTNNFNNIQCITTPTIPLNDSTQGYWESPAYWKYTSGSTTNYMLYYSATMQSSTAGVAPEAINGYQLLTSGTSGPIPTTYASTSTLFCDFSPTPSISSNGTAPTSGILWAVEQNQNLDNRGGSNPDCAGGHPTGNPAALHAFCATAGAQGGPCPTALTEIYTSRGLQHLLGPVASFPTPTVFSGQVYVGTMTSVNVFGLCSTQPTGQCLN